MEIGAMEIGAMVTVAEVVPLSVERVNPTLIYTRHVPHWDELSNNTKPHISILCSGRATHLQEISGFELVNYGALHNNT